MAVIVDGKNAYSANVASLDANVAVAPGAHSATVQATDNTGATYTSSAVSFTATNVAPSASLAMSSNSASVGTAVTATVSASDADGSISNYSINFGDGFVATTATASHAYATAGTYTVTATVTDNNGAKATSSATVAVVAAGLFVSSPAPGATVGSPVHFAANAVATPGKTINLIRIYVDGVNAYQVGAATLDTNLPLAAGTHNINMQSWDNTGTLYKTTFSITVPAATNQAPTVALSLSADTVVTGAVVTAKVTASDPDGTIASYSVDFGDGTVVTTSSASHAYTKAGTYTVTATTTDNKGARKSTDSVVSVIAPGVYVTSAAQGSTAGSPVHFVASTTPQAGRTVSLMRIYVDGVNKYQVSAASLNTNITLPKGTHNVSIQAWDTLATLYKTTRTITTK
jgi:PKD repeat protein